LKKKEVLSGHFFQHEKNISKIDNNTENSGEQANVKV